MNHFCKTINRIKRGRTDIVLPAIKRGKFSPKFPCEVKNLFKPTLIKYFDFEFVISEGHM